MEVTIHVPSGSGQVDLLGMADRNLKMIREALGVKVVARDGEIRLSGDPGAVTVARNVMHRLQQTNGALTRRQMLEVIAEEADRAERPGLAHPTRPPAGPTIWEGDLEVFAAGRRVVPKTPNQIGYLEAIRTSDLTFGIGPAGTGKTYLAVAAAVHLLKSDRARRIVLVRPAVEAGEKLGFLPGDIGEKVNPYIRPLLDALHDMIDYSTLRRFMTSDVVEIAPLAFMRGRTLNNAVVILDEAQNTTMGQMKMFLTRMGHGSKMIVTGDVTQIDLEDPTRSGLIDAARRLRRVPGVSFAALDGSDVVRHSLVQRIVEAYGEEPPRSGQE